ncbi:RlmE family RNA methyltransferase [Enterobacteriaceae endosymbiont of Neohaemonia nigricornis]|uniref:RlmE family RNA methyltransferase n=1 Tax=Enterobacteriaceae endosymbiont of Neohaemonia nigricornis TaxID=2675792 RepID=UPI001449F159|nr:SAM-dependent methyltransferase [Enterobacteriaceae endosymbiont of Neohaemonia nigricornis]QJC30501.1 hypothetical protein GJT85_01620 [Enterobacteriaceae endosymbiont of Neohaemonia nigricornis]
MTFINTKKNISRKTWLKNHFNDYYVKQTQVNIKKFRSRSWFKLSELHKQDKIFKKGMYVIDLGSSPGGWSCFAASTIGHTGKVIACDILPMNNIHNVDFFTGNIFDSHTLKLLANKLNAKKVHVIMSDISPNISGIKIIDAERSVNLNILVLNLCKIYLAYQGTLIMKVFHNNNFKYLCNMICNIFYNIKIRKPNASRSKSCEIYVVAKGYKHQ